MATPGGHGLRPVRNVATYDVVPLAFASCRALDQNPTFRYSYNIPALFQQDLVSALSAQLAVAVGAASSAVACCLDGPLGTVVWYRRPGPHEMDPVRLQTPGAYERSVELFNAYQSMIPSEPHLLLAFIAVDPPHQRAGNGTSLLAVVFSEADQQGVPVITVTSDHAAARWLVHRGFEAVGTARAPGVPDQVVLRRDCVAVLRNRVAG